MNFPFVFRCDHDARVAELKADKSALEQENRRLYDLIFKQQFGVQIFDSITEILAPPVTAAAPVVVDPVTPEDEMEQENQRDIERLSVIRRTSPTRLGTEMAAVMAK